MSEPVKLLAQTELPDRSGLTGLEIQGHSVLVYHPFDPVMDRHSDIINYAFTSPTFVVFGDEDFTAEGAVRFAKEINLTPIAAENGSNILFVNPMGTWDDDEANQGIYEALLASMKLGLMDFKHGLFQEIYHPTIFERLPDYVKASRPIPHGEYYIHGCGIRSHMIAAGKGADFVCRHYLKKIGGQGELGDLGKAEMTVTSCTLAEVNALPEEYEKTNIIVVSVNNREDIEEGLAQRTENFHKASALDLSVIFDETIGHWQRWLGKLSPAHNYRLEGITVLPKVITVKTDPDHVDLSMVGPEHSVGFVVFHDASLNVSPDAENKLPLLFCFHGGGDTAIATAGIGEWPEIAKDNGFILVAVEYHLQVPASEVMQVLDYMKAHYPVDETRLYATGFSMGGIKTWDLFQEYPETFAALAPMCATVDVGDTCQFIHARTLNETIPVPTFWVGGEASPLPELPFQGKKCLDRMSYLLKVNRCQKQCSLSFEEKDRWENSFIGVNGNDTVTALDPAFPNSVTTMDRFLDEEGQIRTVVAHVSHQMHEIRPNTCRLAWAFMKQFQRLPNGSIQEA